MSSGSVSRLMHFDSKIVFNSISRAFLKEEGLQNKPAKFQPIWTRSSTCARSSKFTEIPYKIVIILCHFPKNIACALTLFWLQKGKHFPIYVLTRIVRSKEVHNITYVSRALCSTFFQLLAVDFYRVFGVLSQCLLFQKNRLSNDQRSLRWFFKNGTNLCTILYGISVNFEARAHVEDRVQMGWNLQGCFGDPVL